MTILSAIYGGALIGVFLLAWKNGDCDENT